jgi:hypothetical protein
MTDDKTTRPGSDDVFDDDRLLAFALGLDDDPELAVAAAADPALRRRLDAIVADIGRIDAHLRAAVPASDENYVDLGAERWAHLGRAITERAPQPERRRRAALWLRVALPVAALAVAAVVGVAVVSHLGGSSPRPSTGTAAEGAPHASAQFAPATDGTAQLKVQGASDFAVVVVARASAAQGTRQSFTVVRTLKGSAPAVVRLRVLHKPVAAGSLHVLLLQPLPNRGVGSASGSVSPSSTPLPVPASSTKGSTGQRLAAGTVSYSYLGQPAFAQALPAGTDPASIALP